MPPHCGTLLILLFAVTSTSLVLPNARKLKRLCRAHSSARVSSFSLRNDTSRFTLKSTQNEVYVSSKNDTSLDQTVGCNINAPSQCLIPSDEGKWYHDSRNLLKLAELQEAGFGSVALLLATATSLYLANSGSQTAWLNFWSSSVGPTIGGHALSVRGWVNEGLMAIFFFVVGLEIKQELRQGSLASVQQALLPCIAACGGMIVPMLVYALAQGSLAGGSLAGLAIPMATDIAFAMAIFGFFRGRMPAASSTFLLTLATVDDLGAIIVLATCFSSSIAFKFLGSAALLTLSLAGLCQRRVADIRIYAAGGAAIWWSLLRAGVNADIAGVLCALCISTKAEVTDSNGQSSNFVNELIVRISPLTTFFVMPMFALANTAVPLGSLSPGATSAMPISVGIALGLLLGKPLGIFGSTWLATKLGVARMPDGMQLNHLGIVSMLGAVGFTMCLLLAEVSLPALLQPIPKLAILLSSVAASLISAAAMWRLPLTPNNPPVVEDEIISSLALG